MAKKRFTINGDGDLVDRDGLVLGKVTSITIDMPNDALAWGTIGGHLKATEGESEDGGVGEGARGEGLSDAHLPMTAKVDLVWAHAVEVLDPPNKTLTPSRVRMLKRGIIEGGSVQVAMQAIDGLKAWQAMKGGDLNLSRVFTGRPQGRPLSEQIEFFASQAPGADSRSDLVPSETAAEISSAKRDVIYGTSFPGNELAQQKAKAAIEKLKQHGITATYSGDGTPSSPRQVLFITSDGPDAAA